MTAQTTTRTALRLSALGFGLALGVTAVVAFTEPTPTATPQQTEQVEQGAPDAAVAEPDATAPAPTSPAPTEAPTEAPAPEPTEPPATTPQPADEPSPADAVIEEDDPRWDCRTMGNRICGTDIAGTRYLVEFDEDGQPIAVRLA